MHWHEQARTQLLDEATQVVWMGMTAGMALEEMAARDFYGFNQGAESWLTQVTWPVGKDAGGALRKFGSIELRLHGLPEQDYEAFW